MSNCDVCNRPTTWKEGTTYTADEFRTLVSKGFEPDKGYYEASKTKYGRSRSEALAFWRTKGVVADSTTDWLLCPPCAQRGAQYLPKSAGTGPISDKLEEEMTREQLTGYPGETSRSSQQSPEDPLREVMERFAKGAGVNPSIFESLYSPHTASSPAAEQPRKKRWWQFWK